MLPRREIAPADYALPVNGDFVAAGRHRLARICVAWHGRVSRLRPGHCHGAGNPAAPDGSTSPGQRGHRIVAFNPWDSKLRRVRSCAAGAQARGRGRRLGRGVPHGPAAPGLRHDAPGGLGAGRPRAGGRVSTSRPRPGLALAAGWPRRAGWTRRASRAARASVSAACSPAADRPGGPERALRPPGGCPAPASCPAAAGDAAPLPATWEPNDRRSPMWGGMRGDRRG